MGRKSNARERIIAAAKSSFWNKSCGSVSVDALCLEAGVNKGSIYHFFNSKSAIIHAAIDAWWKELQVLVIEPAFDPEVAPLDRIENLFRNQYDYQKQKQKEIGRVPGCPFCNLGIELSAQDESVRIKIEEIFDRYKVYIAFAINEARETGELSGNLNDIVDAVFSYFCGLILQAKIRNDPAIIINLLPALRKIIVDSGNNSPGISF